MGGSDLWSSTLPLDHGGTPPKQVDKSKSLFVTVPNLEA